MAGAARVLEQQRADAHAVLPSSARRLRADRDHGADGLVGAGEGQRGFVHALVDLVVSVAEAGGADADEEVTGADGRDGHGLELVGFVELGGGVLVFG